MRILLVNTNRERSPQPVIPLGLCLVASACRAEGHQVRVVDLTFSAHPVAELSRALSELRPQVAGLSIRNLDNGEFLHPKAYLPEVQPLVETCRRSGAFVVIGGPAVSILPNELLKYMGADWAVAGDGERTLPILVHFLSRGIPLEGIPGLVGAGQFAGPDRIDRLDRLPPASPNRWLDLRPYLRYASPVPVQTKRGCPFECIYCTYRFIEGAQCRTRSPELVAAEIEEMVASSRARHFEFVDSTFNHPLDHALKLCEQLIRPRVKASFHTAGINPLSCSPELFELMVKAGFESAVCAPESGSEQMLISLKKGFSADHAAHAVEWAHQARLPMLWSFLFGGPGENERTVGETISFMDRYLDRHDRIIATFGMRIYPGTELERIAREQGQLLEGASLLEPAFYFSEQTTPEAVLERLSRSRWRRNLLLLSDLQRPELPLLVRLRTALRIRGPAWRAVPIYNLIRRGR